MGYGICKHFHGDIEYYYAVQGTILKVYEVHWPVEDDEPKEEHFKLLKIVRLNPKKRCPACVAA
jgi:hypothetical protein